MAAGLRGEAPRAGIRLDRLLLALAVDGTDVQRAMELRRTRGEQRHGRQERGPMGGDWEVYPTTSWNYALEIDEATWADDIAFQEHPLGDTVFSPDGAPVSAEIRGRPVGEWGVENGSAQEVPPAPDETQGPEEDLVLVPYGCTNLRIAEFPVMR